MNQGTLTMNDGEVVYERNGVKHTSDSLKGLLSKMLDDLDCSYIAIDALKDNDKRIKKVVQLLEGKLADAEVQHELDTDLLRESDLMNKDLRVAMNLQLERHRTELVTVQAGCELLKEQQGRSGLIDSRSMKIFLTGVSAGLTVAWIWCVYKNLLF